MNFGVGGRCSLVSVGYCQLGVENKSYSQPIAYQFVELFDLRLGLLRPGLQFCNLRAGLTKLFKLFFGVSSSLLGLLRILRQPSVLFLKLVQTGSLLTVD